MRSKKILAFVLSMTLMLPVATTVDNIISNEGVVSISADEIYTAESDFTIQYDTDTMTATITAYKGTDTIVNIPPTVTNGRYTVTALKEGLFKDNTTITSVTIPNTIAKLPGHLFDGCKSLTEVNLHDDIVEISAYAFSNCTSLKDITLSNSLTGISYCCFKGCTSLESIIIPEGVTIIYGGAFENCTSLSKVTLPTTLTTIGTYWNLNWNYDISGYTFNNCTSLKEITLPSSLNTLNGKQNLGYGYDSATDKYYAMEDFQIYYYGGENEAVILNYASENNLLAPILLDEQSTITEPVVEDPYANYVFDVNQDGDVNVVDLLVLKKRILKII